MGVPERAVIQLPEKSFWGINFVQLPGKATNSPLPPKKIPESSGKIGLPDKYPGELILTRLPVFPVGATQIVLIDLRMGIFGGAVFHDGRVPENNPLALMGRHRFPPLMGSFLECLNGPFSLQKIALKTAH